MAIFHLSTKPISRSSGRSSTASAAYRAACEITDNRTGLKHDYSKKGGVIFSMAVDKNGIDLDRSELWNLAEKSENRKDARTAREWVVAIPAELVTETRDGENGMKIDPEKGILAVLDFAYHLADEYNVGFDVAIHSPDTAGDNRNYHAHIMTTTRELSHTKNGLVLGAKTSLEWSNTKRKNENLLTTTADEIKVIRARWEQIANTHLENAGRNERIDHRSFKERGLNIEPTIKLGWQASAMERDNKPTRQGDVNRAVAIQNEIITLGEERDEIITSAIATTVDEINWTDDVIGGAVGRIERHERQSITAHRVIASRFRPTPNPYTDRARARKLRADELSGRAKSFDRETEQYRDRAAAAAAELSKRCHIEFNGRYNNSEKYDDRQMALLNDFADKYDLNTGDVRQKLRSAHVFFESMPIFGNEKIIQVLCDPIAERIEYEKTGNGLGLRNQLPKSEPVPTVSRPYEPVPTVSRPYRSRRP